ncbi:MAG: hypothetical protein KO316_05100 [Methanobacterium sp.]|jgi:glycerophosphoryl diester phosphodiesterase|nr:hypothetical protein [Methanobacterium sp.]
MKIIAHRGASALEPENTLRSLSQAFQLDVDMVEIDVHQSKDGELVVIHDNTLDRTTNGTGLVREKTLPQLKELDAGKGETIPTLREVLKLVKERSNHKGQESLLIEIKEPDIEKQVLNNIKKENMLKEVIVASFYHNVSLDLKSMEKSLKTGVIFVSQPVHPEMQAIHAQADIMFPFFHYLSEKMVEDAHQQGIKVYTGVVDTVKDLKSVSAMGVDGFVSNRLFDKNLIP